MFWRGGNGAQRRQFLGVRALESGAVFAPESGHDDGIAPFSVRVHFPISVIAFAPFFGAKTAPDFGAKTAPLFGATIVRFRVSAVASLLILVSSFSDCQRSPRAGGPWPSGVAPFPLRGQRRVATAELLQSTGRE